MLRLERKDGQYVDLVIPPSSEETRISIVVYEFQGRRCRMGVAAPSTVEIQRRERKKGKPSASTDLPT